MFVFFEEGDETIFILPDELKCDEEVSLRTKIKKQYLTSDSSFFFEKILVA